jgi:hypothetical protein
MIKPQAIRKGISITLNGKEVEKQEIIDLSKEWNSNQELLFRKTLQQGGEVTIKGIHIKIVTKEKMVNSKGEKDPGIVTVPGVDQRF